MGFFSKLKQNMNHGGVKVRIQAPSSVPQNQVIPVSVNITSDSPQTIIGVKVEIMSQAKEQGVNLSGGGVGARESWSNAQAVAKAENRDPFTINPEETKTVTLDLYINGNPTGMALGQMNNGFGQALQTIASVAQNFDRVTYTYSVHASAEVQGIQFSPSDNFPIQVLPPSATQPVMQASDNTSTQNQSMPTPSIPVQPPDQDDKNTPNQA